MRDAKKNRRFLLSRVPLPEGTGECNIFKAPDGPEDGSWSPAMMQLSRKPDGTEEAVIMWVWVPDPPFMAGAPPLTLC